MSTVSEDIVKGFLYKLQNDPQLKIILKGIKENGGDYKDAEKYAGRAGQLLTEVFKANITSGNFPVGSVKDIASLIVPAMELNHTAVTQVTGMVQKALNKDGGFGMNPIKSSFDKSGAYNLVGRMAKYESFEDAAFMLDEPVQTASRAMTDAMLHDNADFQYKSGMRPKIVRTCESDACEWCQMLEGEYDYEEVRDRGDPVYQRHNNCACEITYEPGDGRVQDVYSKQWQNEESVLRRKSWSENEQKAHTYSLNQHKDSNVEKARSGDDVGSYIKTPGQREIETAIQEQSLNHRDSSLLGNAIINNHADLKNITPQRMQSLLEKAGIKVNTLSRSKHGFNDKSLSEGGGFVSHFGGDGVLQYHPEGGLHKISYWKMNTGKGGKHHYDTNGREFVIEKDGTIKFID